MQDVSSLPLDAVCLPQAEIAVATRACRPMRWRQWVETLAWAIVLFVGAQTWLVQGYKVFGCCMEPNLYTGERLLGSKLGLMQGVQRGDVVVFRPPHKSETVFIKRVIGLPGDVLEIRDSRVYLNSRRVEEPYLQRAWHDDRPPQRIPADSVYVLGDNRDNSNDSRAWGLLPIKNIQAKAWVRYWPPTRFAWIR